MTAKVKDSVQRPLKEGQARFRDLIAWWADQLGRHHIPFKEHTADINDLLAPDAVHHELIQQVVRAVYRANGCGHLNAAISLDPTFSALGQVRSGLSNSPRADIDQINLLDNLGWHTSQYFGCRQDAIESTSMEGELAPAEIHILSRSVP